MDTPSHPMNLPYSSANAARRGCLSWPIRRPTSTFTSSLRGDNILVIVGRNATEEYLAHLREKHISYVIVDDATDLRQGLEAVGREFGIRSVSVQGGGILNGALLADGLIDELRLGDLSRYRRAFGCAFHLRVRGRRNRSSGRGTTPSTALRIRKRTWRNMATL